ncbi:hypothetical protein RclHR1_21550003 [Rhizophagus clarus]|uniref:Uncharacterized protein n=1 Tax=Rhizophagus clarus TaxID=94130 RepID=A0A2Z6QT52_9GLOM|nr:hypothetical protein RclHR1_21550003 [Rhizophagus clarus]
MIKCLALWKDGPLYYDHDKYEYDRLQNKEVALCKSQNITDGFSFRVIDKWCKMCQKNYLEKNFTKWISGNKIIDNLFNEMHFKVGSCDDVIFEWIQYNQFNDIKKLGKSGLYSEMVHYITTIVRAYLIENYYDNNILNIYRISQHPETKDFIMVLHCAVVYIFRILGLCGDVVNTVGNEQITHSQAIYTSRLLNPFTKDLSRYNDDDELLECAIND